MKILKWDEKKDGPLSEAALRRKIERLGYATSCYTYPPGTYFSEHTHAQDKIDGVLSGRFEMGTSEGVVVLESGDCLEVPKGTPHTARVVGKDPVVSIDAVKI